MEKISDRSFIGESVRCDDCAFINCTFENCVFLFGGTAMFAFSDCRTDESCRLQLDGCAERTIKVLRDLMQSSGPWAGFAAQLAQRLTENGLQARSN